MKKPLTILAVIVGLGFLILAFIYWTTPASGLPMFFPGYNATMATVHFKHGLAALILGLGCFVFAWFNSGKKQH
jgi:hypothetical protein